MLRRFALLLLCGFLAGCSASEPKELKPETGQRFMLYDPNRDVAFVTSLEGAPELHFFTEDVGTNVTWLDDGHLDQFKVKHDRVKALDGKHAGSIYLVQRKNLKAVK